MVVGSKTWKSNFFDNKNKFNRKTLVEFNRFMEGNHIFPVLLLYKKKVIKPPKIGISLRMIDEEEISGHDSGEGDSFDSDSCSILKPYDKNM